METTIVYWGYIQVYFGITDMSGQPTCSLHRLIRCPSYGQLVLEDSWVVLKNMVPWIWVVLNT